MSGMSRASAMAANFESTKDKIQSPDYDIRQQTLIDLQRDVREAVQQSGPSRSSSSRVREEKSYCDEHTEGKYVQVVLKLVLEDENAEVKNEGVKCIELLAAKSRPVAQQAIIKGLLNGLVSDKDEVRNIACSALKRVAEVLPESTQQGQLLEPIIKQIFAIITKTSPPPDSQIASELLQILRDIYLRYPTIISQSSSLQELSISSLLPVLANTRNPSIRKRAIEAVPALISTRPTLFDDALKSKLAEGLAQNGDQGNAWVGLVAALAREQSAVSRMGSMIAQGKIVDLLLGHTTDTEQVEAVEVALVALDALVLRCPTEIKPYIGAILSRSLELVKYDPNYVEIDEEDDVDMNGEDDDEEDDYDDDAYSDEEDVSWKIRRASAKVVSALVGTRNELLIEFYKTAAPVLIARFSEREESVRLEILSAFETLLRQTAQARAAEAAALGRNKRKRSQGMEEDDDEETPTKHLGQQFNNLLRAILKQLGSKSVPTRQQCFVLLRQTDEALQGGLEGEADAICKAAVAAVQSVDSATSSSLAMAALSFLSVFFRHHSARVYAAHLQSLVPAVVRCMKDKIQRVTFEAFAAASALAQSLRPKGSSSPLATNYSRPVQQLFEATTQVLGDTTVDGEVRERALDTLGHLLVHEGDALKSSYSTCLPLISARLNAETTALTAVQVIGRTAESQLCKGPDFDMWLLETLPQVVIALRKTRRSSSKNAEFACLQAIIGRVGGALPGDTAISLLTELKPFVEAPAALSTIAMLISFVPASTVVVTQDLLPAILEAIKTPSVNPQLVDALSAFFSSYTAQDPSQVPETVRQLNDNLGSMTRIPDATQGGTSIFSTTASCIGAVAQGAPEHASSILKGFQRNVKSVKGQEAPVYLALLCIGEIGRTTDLSGEKNLLDLITTCFEDESEEVRSAAAFALGNLAVGSPNVFLPALLQRIQGVKEESSRLLLLHALKEVIQHSPIAQLESLADSLWVPLFAEEGAATSRKSKAKAVTGTEDIGDDGIRNVKAACIGKLTTTAPGKFLPQLQDLLKSSPRNRAIVAAAVRYTFIDTSSSYDELIAPIIVDFLSLMRDDNLIVRRLSLASLNAAIQNKPHLVIDRLGALQGYLYQETYTKPELQREVQMGPWKVIEDDGLENRKTAYETMYTLLGACFSKVDLPTFTDRVMAALRDVNEIKVLGLMLLLRLGQLSPASVIPRLDEVAEALKVIMKDLEVKDDTVKQDIERKNEMQRTTLRTAVPLYRMSSAKDAPAFHLFVGALLSRKEWEEFANYQA